VSGAHDLDYLSVHDKGAISGLCEPSYILLNSGRLVREGVAEEVMDYYMPCCSAFESAAKISQQAGKDNKIQIHFRGGKAEVTDIALFDSEGCELTLVRVGQPRLLRIAVAGSRQYNELLSSSFVIKGQTRLMISRKTKY